MATTLPSSWYTLLLCNGGIFTEIRQGPYLIQNSDSEEHQKSFNHFPILNSSSQILFVGESVTCLVDP